MHRPFILTFLNRAHRIPLGSLPLGDIGTYYVSAFGRLKKTFAPSALEAAVSATRGYHYLLQLIGYYLANYSEHLTEITTDLVALAAADSRRDMVESIFEPVLKPLSNKDRDFLKAMSRDRGTSRIANIAKRLKVSQAYAQKYRRRLIESGVIAASGRGELELIVPYLDEYLRGEF